MAELETLTYEQARAEYFEELMKKAQRRMKYWEKRLDRTRPYNLMDEAHGKAADAGWEYNFYKDALEALENNSFQYETGFVKGFEAAQPKWISIKEQLPTRELRVLTINGHGLIRIFGFFKRTEKAWTWIDDAGHFNHCNDITHWMPLPEAPKEG